MSGQAQKGSSSSATNPRGAGGGTLLLALLPCFALGVFAAGRGLEDAALPGAHGLAGFTLQALLPALLLLGICLASAAAVTALFARLTRRPPMEGAATAAFLFVLTVPLSTPVVPAALSLVFGLVVGREVFGTPERSFVHPAVLAHVFLSLAWPAALDGAATWLPPDGATDQTWAAWLVLSPVPGTLGAASALACLVGGSVLVVRRLIAWRVAVAVPIGVAVALALLGRTEGLGPSMLALPAHLTLGSLAFGAAFLAGAANSSPATSSGRWFHGALVGFLVVLFRQTVDTAPDGTMNAILLASVFAPLTDHVVNAWRAEDERSQRA